MHRRRAKTPSGDDCNTGKVVVQDVRGSETSPSRRFLKRRSDSIVTALFTLIALATRFYRIQLPPAVVFDELHFSKFTDRILTQTWFFDIHPPLGKLILSYTSYVLGYRADPSFVIEKIGSEYPAHVKYYIVRSVSAAFSVGTVPLTYIIARKLDISTVSSAVSTTCVLLDFLGVIEGRLILLDSQLLFFCQLTLLFALHLWQTRPRTRQRAVWLFLTGATAGTALSIKHTALATPGLIAVVSFFGLHFLSDPLDLVECLYAAICGFAVYAAFFFVSFNVLWKTGGKYDNFMPLHFRKTLIGADSFDPTAKRVSFPRLFFYINKRMITSNAGIKKRHSWESDWYHWIVNWRGVLYYVHRGIVDGRNSKSIIYLMGNPVVIYMALLSVAAFCLMLALSVRYRRTQRSWLTSRKAMWARGNGIFLLAGWLCNLLPYIFVHRAAFIYHYIPALFYAQLLCGFMLDRFPVKLRNMASTVAIGSMAAAFWYWSAWIYGLPLSEQQHKARQWLPRWT